MLESKIQKAVIKTLAYSDVFDYPLKKQEIWKFLNTGAFIKKEFFDQVLFGMIGRGMISKVRGYYFLNGRKKIIAERIKRKKISFDKLKIARKAAKMLSLIPTVKFIGVSGSLSLNNARLQDDIDLFIVTSKNSLWITRFIVNALLLLSRSKRSVKDLRGMNLICPNLFMVENELGLSANRRNLFSAREISQLYILFDRGNTHKRFLAANSWVKKHLVNIKIPNKIHESKDTQSNILSFFDKVFYAFQFIYMSDRITGEEVRRKVAFFHPQDKGQMIMKIYKLRYEKYSKNILQDIDKKSPILYI